ncbi:MAG: ParB/RepB/Spo0J family partition protein [Blastocatellia bacterium]|nr:ParB/RepB/Spo0J family partition protein [Blastocatellia bacterium]
MAKSRVIPPSFSPERKSALASLLQDKPQTSQEVELRLIQPNPFQPRTVIDDVAIDQLAENIRKYGLLQNLVCRPDGVGRFTLIAGQRRLLALQKLGWQSATVTICDRVTNDDLRLVALIENLQRETLHPVDEVRALFEVVQQAGTQEAAAQLLNIPLGTIGYKTVCMNLGEDVLNRCLAIPQISLNTLHRLLQMPVEQRLEAIHSLASGGRTPPATAKTRKTVQKPFIWKNRTETQASFSLQLKFKKKDPTADEIFSAVKLVYEELAAQREGKPVILGPSRKPVKN